MKMSVVKIVNLNPYDWMGTQYFIDEHKVPRVKSVDFHVSVDEVPTFNFEMMGRPDIEMECLAQISVSSQSITDAISVLRHELLQRNIPRLQIKPEIGSGNLFYMRASV